MSSILISNEDFNERIENGDHDKLVDTIRNIDLDSLWMLNLSPPKEVLFRILHRFGHSLSKDQAIDLCAVLDGRYEGPEGALEAIRNGVLERFVKPEMTPDAWKE